MRRILNWYFGNGEQPAFYMERDYTPLHVRLYAGITARGDGLKVDIRDDGTSIFRTKTPTRITTKQVDSEIQYSAQSGAFTAGETVTGGTSSATAVVRFDTLGNLQLTQESVASFSVGETITGGTSGSTATVDSFVRGSPSTTITVGKAENVAILPAGANLDTMAEDFANEGATIAEGSIVTCHKVESNGANDITVQLELESLDSDEEVD
jgi:hypothetical protein